MSISTYRIWNEPLRLSGVKYVSAFRHHHSWKFVQDEPTAVPIRSTAQMEKLIACLPNLQAVLFTSNNGMNVQIVRTPEIRHVFIGHGDSEKSSSANKVFRLYDEVWVSGDAHLNRFSKISGNFSSIDFVKIGQPWMKSFLNLNKEGKPPSKGLGWLYLPTWHGAHQDSRYSSLHFGTEIVQAVSRYFGQAMVKPHPWTRTSSVSKLVRGIGKKHNILSKSDTIRSCLNAYPDLIVCDISAAVTEALYTQKPIFVHIPEDKVQIVQGRYDYAYTFTTVEDLQAKVKDLSEGNDPLAEARKRALQYMVDIDATRNDKFDEELRRLVSCNTAP